MLLTQFASAQGSEPLELRSYFGQLDKPEDGCVSIHAMTEYLLRPPQTSAVPVKTPPPPPPLVQVMRASQGHLEHLGSRLRSGYSPGLVGVTHSYPPPHPLCPILLPSCPARPGVPSPESPPFWSPHSHASPSPAQCKAALSSLSILLRQVFWRSRLWPPSG